MSTLKVKIFSIYKRLFSSIAFYPSLILVLFLITAGLMLSFEDSNTTKWLIEHAPYLVINNADTARSILSTMIGGLISLMVFNFSMVMMILNQASSNFSPRLLPGLISDKRNQIVLGAYLGTIVYNIIILMSVLPEGNKYTLNGFSILLGMIMAISCLGAFIYFIHTISNSIQINNILENIFNTTKNKLLYLINKDVLEDDTSIGEQDDWHYIKSTSSGYYQGVNLKGLLEFCQKTKVSIKVIPFKGSYILPNIKLAAIDKKLDESEIKSLKEYLIFSDSLDIQDNYSLGIKHMTEVGIKAMSPGINDPGTALMTINYLTEIITLRMKLDEKEVYASEDKNYILELQPVSFKTLMYRMLAEYRQYCKHDIILMEKIVKMLLYLLKQPAKNQSYYDILEKELAITKTDIQDSISNPSDKKKLLELI